MENQYSAEETAVIAAVTVIKDKDALWSVRIHKKSVPFEKNVLKFIERLLCTEQGGTEYEADYIRKYRDYGLPERIWGTSCSAGRYGESGDRKSVV